MGRFLGTSSIYSGFRFCWHRDYYRYSNYKPVFCSARPSRAEFFFRTKKKKIYAHKFRKKKKKFYVHPISALLCTALHNHSSNFFFCNTSYKAPLHNIINIPSLLHHCNTKNFVVAKKVLLQFLEGNPVVSGSLNFVREK